MQCEGIHTIWTWH